MNDGGVLPRGASSCIIQGAGESSSGRTPDSGSSAQSLRDGLVVGHLTLDQAAQVRILVPQPKFFYKAGVGTGACPRFS